MRRLLHRVAEWFSRVFRPRPKPRDCLTAVQYEAVSLIAYEGRAAYKRACEQADYCRGRGSEQGFRFWSEVAGEVACRTGKASRKNLHAP